MARPSNWPPSFEPGNKGEKVIRHELTRHGVTHKRPDFSVEGSGKFFETTSKRALWIALKHLCAKDTGRYDEALEDGAWFNRMKEEIENTKGCE